MFDQRAVTLIDLNALQDVKVLKEGAAYRYVDSATNKELVVKIISDYIDEDDAILISEFRKLAAMSAEPEFAMVYFLAKIQIDQEEKSCYVMEFIEGYDLNDFIENNDFINYKVAVDIIIQIASGLEKAHHYDIFHNDLHGNNIRINTLEYVKIIDFLWRDISSNKKNSRDKDLIDFKLLVDKICNKCENKHENRIKFINSYCQNITSFTGVRSVLKKIDKVSFDLDLLRQDSIRILSKLIELIENGSNRSLMIQIVPLNLPEIPEIFLPPLTGQDQDYIIENETYIEQMMQQDGMREPDPNVVGPKYHPDTRIIGVKETINHHLNYKFSSLKNLNLINVKIWPVVAELAFVGPYKVSIEIGFTSRFIELREVNNLVKILRPVEEDLLTLVLEPNDMENFD